MRTAKSRHDPLPRCSVSFGSEDGTKPSRNAANPQKLNDFDPQAWPAVVFVRLTDHPAQRIDELLPSKRNAPAMP